jgi:hypothetical protein
MDILSVEVQEERQFVDGVVHENGRERTRK